MSKFNSFYNKPYFLNESCQNNIEGFCLKKKIEIESNGKKLERLQLCYESEKVFCPLIAVSELPAIPKTEFNVKYYTKDEFDEFESEDKPIESKKFSKRIMKKFGEKTKLSDLNYITDKQWRELKRNFNLNSKTELKHISDQVFSDIKNYVNNLPPVLKFKNRQKGIIKAILGRDFIYARCSYCHQSNLIPLELMEHFKEFGCEHIRGFWNSETGEFYDRVVWDKYGDCNMATTSNLKFVFSESDKIVW